MKKMSIGETIKSIAIVVGVVGILVSLIWGVSLFENYKPWKDDLPIGAIVLFGGSICSLISASLMYGFGHLICQVDTLVEMGEPKRPKSLHNSIFSYNCKSFDKTGIKMCGKCDICGYEGSILEYCTVTTNEGEKGWNICTKCQDKFKEKSNQDNNRSTSNSRIRCPSCGCFHDLKYKECPACGHKY